MRLEETWEFIWSTASDLNRVDRLNLGFLQAWSPEHLHQNFLVCLLKCRFPGSKTWPSWMGVLVICILPVAWKTTGLNDAEKYGIWFLEGFWVWRCPIFELHSTTIITMKMIISPLLLLLQLLLLLLCPQDLSLWTQAINRFPGIFAAYHMQLRSTCAIWNATFGSSCFERKQFWRKLLLLLTWSASWLLVASDYRNCQTHSESSQWFDNRPL